MTNKLMKTLQIIACALTFHSGLANAEETPPILEIDVGGIHSEAANVLDNSTNLLVRQQYLAQHGTEISCSSLLEKFYSWLSDLH